MDEEQEIVRITKLHVWGDDFDPHWVTGLMGVEPSRAYQKGGHPPPDPKGKPRTITYQRSHWAKEVDDALKGAEITIQLVHWVRFLEPRQSAIETLIKAGCQIYIDCYLDEGAMAKVELPATVMASLGKLGISLKLAFCDWSSPDLGSLRSLANPHSGEAVGEPADVRRLTPSVTTTAEGKHEFRVANDEVEYLKQLALSDQLVATMLKFEEGSHGGKALVRLDRGEVESVRHYLTVQLAKSGFDENYDLNEQGRMLENLIDRFYLS